MINLDSATLINTSVEMLSEYTSEYLALFAILSIINMHYNPTGLT